jgi:N4-(beta-N-acetylglucosaminyl)-L-asparaginase
MINRRHFLRKSILSAGALALTTRLRGQEKTSLTNEDGSTDFPLVVSTWASNVKANAAAWEILATEGRALDAVEAGVRVPEADPEDTSVGYGGLPDRDGHVTLDACIMDDMGNCGSVMGLEHIMHAISVARKVMEQTPHVVLVGQGALEFALAQGFKKQNLLTPESEKIWKEWLKTSKYNPMDTLKHMKGNRAPGAKGNHDTIGMLAMDSKGNLAGACTTSGMAFKMRGRVGDSPIIGAGLFVDNEVGAATATGVGEEVIRICGSHTIVEAMRHGMGPQEACNMAVERLNRLRGDDLREKQVGFIAVSRKGEVGAFALREGFTYALRRQNGEDQILSAAHLL